MELRELFSEFSPKSLFGKTSLEVLSLEYDSRHVREGSLFVAIKGNKFDGHHFIEDAFERGACAAIIDDENISVDGSETLKDKTIIVVDDSREVLSKIANRFYNFPSKALKTIGITGTNGKTTTSYLIDSVLRCANKRSSLIGTISYRFADTLIASSLTTPESSDLQKMLDDFRKSGAEYAILEVSSHALQLHRVDDCFFDAGVFTNITPEHLDFHHTLDGYFEAKKRFFDLIRKSRDGGKDPFVVINIDDPKGQELSDNLDVELLTYGIESKKADIRPSFFESTLDGIEATILTPDLDIDITSPLLGQFNLYNILACIGVCHNLGIKEEAIREGIKSLDLVPGRFERISLDVCFDVIVDYAHTPDALFRALSEGRRLCKGRLITVFGCGGNRDKSKRPEMGRAASHISDVLYITSDNPRDEDPLAIIKDILKGVEKDKVVHIIPERDKAILSAVMEGKRGDMVLIAGKGHEDYQVIRGKRIPFDDIVVVRNAVTNCLKEKRCEEVL